MAVEQDHLWQTEQDTLDTYILPYLSMKHGFPKPESLDYQAQHNVPISLGGTGRYDGLYLQGGYPYVVLEAKRLSVELTEAHVEQARAYAVSGFFDQPVPFLVVSNGRDHWFYQRTNTVIPEDGKPAYKRLTETSWHQITKEQPGEIKRILDEAELFATLRDFKARTVIDVRALFLDQATDLIVPGQHPLGEVLQNIVKARRAFAGARTNSSKTRLEQEQEALRQAIEGIALHFTIKILFIKLVEDLARGSDIPTIINSLFPRPEYDAIGGLFGYKVLESLPGRDGASALRLLVKSRNFYKSLAKDLARVDWADIFRFGFSVHMRRYGQLFRARDYDRFLPTETTLKQIHDALIGIDIRNAVVYGAAGNRSNVLGDLYEKLISGEIRSGLGAVYTPEATMKFMVDLSTRYLGQLRGHKIVEPACGSGHFYREIYRRYVDEVFLSAEKAGVPRNAPQAHAEALAHVLGRDIDPFAVQLTLLSAFLEQLKDNVSPDEEGNSRWLGDRSVETQNSLDPITIDPDSTLGIDKTLDLSHSRSLRNSCRRAQNPILLIGNPPYGVNVDPGPGYELYYDLSGHDSYAYFIVNGLLRLQEGGRLIYIVSSSFLTIGSHAKLRKKILALSKIVRVIHLSRHTFPGIDVFPLIIELERCSKKSERDDNIYEFYDLTRLHPVNRAEELTSVYNFILGNEDSSVWPLESAIAARYTVRQGVLPRFSPSPIFEGRVSLYEFMADPEAMTPETEIARTDGSTFALRALHVRGRKIVRLGEIASIKAGLCTGANKLFYFAAPGVRGGAVEGGYAEVPSHLILTDEELRRLTSEEMVQGIEINDPSNDRHFVPLDKPGLSDIKGGLLSMFWRPVEFYVKWSRHAVADMKTKKGARFQNSQHYFRGGITYSNSGIYSPTFRLSQHGVFDQTGSNIKSDALDDEALLGILCSKLTMYFVKSFINHGVHAQPHFIPIALPCPTAAGNIKKAVTEIVDAQRQNSSFDYRPYGAKLDKLVYELYGLTPDEINEVETWYRRHYPKLDGTLSGEEDDPSADTEERSE